MEDSDKRSFGQRLRGLLRKKKEDERCDEEILALVNDYKDQGALEEEEAEMITNIMEFAETQAKDIMTHRSRIDAISTEETLESALHHMLHCNFTRYPLYNGTRDNIVGVLYLKDVMLAYMEGDKDAPLTDIAREPFYVPETLPLDSLFDEMQSKKIHMAVVIDEYGQTAGIVAMEDILEEIVGEILDEYDVVEQETRVTEEALYVSGTISLEELETRLDIHYLPQDEEYFDTLNGLLISLLGHIPEDGEQAELVYGGYIFSVLHCENRMIGDVKISKAEPEALED